jgi:hypothetical protein
MHKLQSKSRMNSKNWIKQIKLSSLIFFKSYCLYQNIVLF